jgi:hypothetical protein
MVADVGIASGRRLTDIDGDDRFRLIAQGARPSPTLRRTPIVLFGNRTVESIIPGVLTPLMVSRQCVRESSKLAISRCGQLSSARNHLLAADPIETKP